VPLPYLRPKKSNLRDLNVEDKANHTFLYVIYRRLVSLSGTKIVKKTYLQTFFEKKSFVRDEKSPKHLGFLGIFGVRYLANAQCCEKVLT